jgi:hypothetical protein
MSEAAEDSPDPQAGRGPASEHSDYQQWQVALQQRLYNLRDTSMKISRDALKGIRQAALDVFGSCKDYFRSIPPEQRIQNARISIYKQRMKNHCEKFEIANGSKNAMGVIRSLDALQRAALCFAQYTLEFQGSYSQFSEYTTQFRESNQYQQLMGFLQNLETSWDCVRAAREDISMEVPDDYQYKDTMVHVCYIGRNDWDRVDKPQYYGQPDPGYYLEHLKDGHKAFIPSHMINAFEAFSDAVKDFAPISATHAMVVAISGRERMDCIISKIKGEKN